MQMYVGRLAISLYLLVFKACKMCREFQVRIRSGIGKLIQVIEALGNCITGEKFDDLCFIKTWDSITKYR